MSFLKFCQVHNAYNRLFIVYTKQFQSVLNRSFEIILELRNMLILILGFL